MIRPLLLALVLCSCTESGPGTADPVDSGLPVDTGVPDDVSFVADVAPILRAKCGACHHADQAVPYDVSQFFDPDVGFVGRENSWVKKGAEETRLVDPGNPDNSFLLVKIDETLRDPETDGNPMPLHRPRLSAGEVDAVRRWIADGALDDATFQDEVAPLFGTAVSFGRAGGRCTDCHYPGTPNGLSVIDVFDPDEGLVGRPARSGGTLVVPGDPASSVLLDRLTRTDALAMPQHPPRVTDRERALVRRWIELGALDD